MLIESFLRTILLFVCLLFFLNFKKLFFLIFIFSKFLEFLKNTKR